MCVICHHIPRTQSQVQYHILPLVLLTCFTLYFFLFYLSLSFISVIFLQLLVYVFDLQPLWSQSFSYHSIRMFHFVRILFCDNTKQLLISCWRYSHFKWVPKFAWLAFSSSSSSIIGNSFILCCTTLYYMPWTSQFNRESYRHTMSWNLIHFLLGKETALSKIMLIVTGCFAKNSMRQWWRWSQNSY